jgi:hypothetical protein
MKLPDRVIKARWIAMGLFAPELVVYNAWMQRRKVNRTTRLARESQAMAKSQDILHPIESNGVPQLVYVMSGFYFKTQSEDKIDNFITGSPN